MVRNKLHTLQAGVKSYAPKLVLKVTRRALISERKFQRIGNEVIEFGYRAEYLCRLGYQCGA